MNSSIISVSFGNIKNKLAESIYLNIKIDVTRPTQIHALINQRCNTRCRMCESWRIENPKELATQDWINTLKSLKAFNRDFNINFSGGEPLLRQDFIEILEFCSRENISVGFTTNGLLLNKKNVDRLLPLNLFNINISVDSDDKEIHDSIRGIRGMLEIVKQNISYLAQVKIKLRGKTPIIIKSIVCKENVKALDKIVHYAQEMKLAGVNFQPIFKWSEESEQMFNVDQYDLYNMIEKLIILKRQGYPVLNSESEIRDWKLHFQGIVPERKNRCVVSLRNLFIDPNGDLSLCPFINNSYIGNVKDGDIRTIWTSKETKEIRKALTNCKKLCTASCTVSRSWKEYIQLLLAFLSTVAIL